MGPWYRNDPLYRSGGGAGRFSVPNPFFGDDGMLRPMPWEMSEVYRRFNDVRNSQWGGRFSQPSNDSVFMNGLRDRGVIRKPPLRESPILRRFDNVPRPWKAQEINRRMDDVRENQWGGRFDQPQPSRPPTRSGGLQPLPFMQNPLDRLARGDFDRFG